MSTPRMVDASVEFSLDSQYNQALEWRGGSADDHRGAKTHATWNQKRVENSALGEFTLMSSIKRWDGAARVSVAWDSLRKDPELWFRDGDCLVHLHGKGQSRRGPAFKVPLQALVELKCFPLLERHLIQDDKDQQGKKLGETCTKTWSRTNPDGKAELFIPAPAMSTKEEALQFHLNTRNFFAWIFRRSLVGEHLGEALIRTLYTVEGLRERGLDNMDEMLNYMDEEGYMNMANQPVHAIAVLRFAEHFNLREVYAHAFTHCVGMYDRLFALSESRTLSTTTKELVKKSGVETGNKLHYYRQMLSNFLEEELSETHLGLTATERLHMERFRSFLYSYWSSRFGKYPPNPMSPGKIIFEPALYRSLRTEFESLYDFLVDRDFNITKNKSLSLPSSAQGGICTLQSVFAFDSRLGFKTLSWPLPLVPKMSAANSSSRRLSWMSRNDKLRPDQRLVAHAALVKATNMDQFDLLNSDLVRAYRRFEEDSVTTTQKSGRPDKLTVADARKVRWILIYGVYQVVRRCTDALPECLDPSDTFYNCCVSTAGVPPWLVKETKRPSAQVALHPSWTVVPVPTVAIDFESEDSHAYEVKPDIDYFALNHRQDGKMPAGTSSILDTHQPRSLHARQKTPRTLRRPLSLFGRSASSNGLLSQQPLKPARRTSYHEIMVHGYGNGMNNVQLSKRRDGASHQDVEAPALAGPVPKAAAPKTQPCPYTQSGELFGVTNRRSSSLSSSASTVISSFKNSLSSSASNTPNTPMTNHCGSNWGSRPSSLFFDGPGLAIPGPFQDFIKWPVTTCDFHSRPDISSPFISRDVPAMRPQPLSICKRASLSPTSLSQTPNTLNLISNSTKVNSQLAAFQYTRCCSRPPPGLPLPTDSHFWHQPADQVVGELTYGAVSAIDRERKQKGETVSEGGRQ